MPLCRSLALLILCGSVSLGAELATLTGVTISGDVVSLTSKEIVLKTATDQVTTPLDQVLDLDLAKAPGPGKDSTYTDVELTDGTLLHCSQVAVKGKQVELTLLADSKTPNTVTLPLEAITYIQKDAQDDKVRREWKDRFLGKKRSRDLLILKIKRKGATEETYEGLEGTLGEADAEGQTIPFTTEKGMKLNPSLAHVHGLIFLRGLDPNATPVICKFHDTSANLVMVSNLSCTEKGWLLATPAGAKISYPTDQVARLDFSKGKLTYLSDDAFWKAGKVKVIQSSTEDRIEKPRRDKNLDDGPIRLAGASYPRGLSLHSRTELEFALDGEYREFKAVIGVDDQVGGVDSPTVVKIEGDGKELFAATITRKEKPRAVTLNIKDVQKLRLVVSSGDFLDLWKHVDFADAKVSK